MNPRTFKNSHEEKEFFQLLRKRVLSKLNTKTIYYGDANFWLKGIFWSIISYASYALLISTENSLYFWMGYFVFQLAGLLIGFSLGHDASHNTAFKNKTSNQILHFYSFLTIGIDPLLWGMRHIRSHHLYANVEGSDVDIDKNPFLRLAPSHDWKPKHRWQHIYAPFVYMLALLHSVFMGDWIYLFSKDYDWIRKGIPRRQLFIRYFAFKIAYFALVLIIPILLSNQSIWFVVITYISTSAFTSLLFVVMLVGTHFFEEAKYYEYEGEEELESSWILHQLKTSCDWNPSSSFARFLSGGSNCHAAHHLFPNICHTNYKKINSIIEKTTTEHNYPYHKKSLFAMMKSHFKHLKRMGNEPWA